MRKHKTAVLLIIFHRDPEFFRPEQIVIRNAWIYREQAFEKTQILDNFYTEFGFMSTILTSTRINPKDPGYLDETFPENRPVS